MNHDGRMLSFLNVPNCPSCLHPLGAVGDGDDLAWTCGGECAQTLGVDGDRP